MDVRVEAAVGLDLGEALLLERLAERLLDELHAVDERRLFVPLGGLERALEVVEDREELLHEPLVGVRDQALLVAQRPLAVVLEVGLRALEEVEVLVALGLRSRERVVDPERRRPRRPTPAPLRAREAGRSRTLRLLLLVDDLVVRVLDDLVLAPRAPSPFPDGCACAEACA